MTLHQFISPRGKLARYDSANGDPQRLLRNIEDAANAPDPERRAIALHCLLRELDERIGAKRTPENYTALVTLLERDTLYDEPDRDTLLAPDTGSVRPLSQSRHH
jgi:hypothetical protein